MANTQFDEFIKREKSRAAGAGNFDAKVSREDWVSDVDALYKLVEKYMGPYIKRGDVKVSFGDIEINEELLGAYKIRRMNLAIGLQQVVFTPIGRIIIGAQGRVDLMGPTGKKKLVRVDKDATRPRISTSAFPDVLSISSTPLSRPNTEIVWKFSTPPPSIQYLDLTEDSLMSSILEVANA